jgi:hypothetical protein
LSRNAGVEKYARPVREDRFIADAHEFRERSKGADAAFDKLKKGKSIGPAECELIDSVLYTVQQAAGVGFDLLGDSNSARKHVGNRFEELIRLVVTSVGITNRKVVFKIPYETESGTKLYSCETDMVLSRGKKVASNATHIDEDEIVVSLKTSSKDRMGKIFLDKMLMERFSGHSVKVVGIFHNDVQRKQSDGISYTFVSGLFMVYTRFLCQLQGVYFLDPPPITEREPYCQYVFPFSRFLSHDIKSILSS